ncbi:MAG: bifunctional folylpolyglutamate synthase/dihydrofolate synthase [Candidatus Dadabacteria bacterium]|nr:MAG: bifunctional folylpolyglutamate synthase/dihydrofolate synthase [Candidatus Dadabacteria bacterium]
MSVGLEYIRSLEQWRGSADFNLDAISQVLDYLGNPQDKVHSVHVAGTNGKGSVAVMLSSILGADGLRVGLLSSPHLSRFNERIVIDGCPISDGLLDRYGAEVKAASEAVGARLTYYEGLVSIGFLAFYREGIERMVVEVGLGGRLDGTNVISKPDIAVITSVSSDHTHILGERLSEIAREKGGIIKEGSHVIVGDLPREALDVITEISERVGVSSIWIKERDFGFDREKNLISFPDRGECNINISLLPSYQRTNALIALACGHYLGASNIAMANGLKNFFWPGRYEEGTINGKRRLIVDCAHNPDGVKKLIDSLTEDGISEASICFGVLESKEWPSMVDMLGEICKVWHLVTPDSSRALQSERVYEYLAKKGISSSIYNEVKEGICCAVNEQTDLPLIVTGSIYMVGLARELIGELESVSGIELNKPYWIRMSKPV